MIWPSVHGTHVPDVHTVSLEHTAPQCPQLESSDSVLTQISPHWIAGGAQPTAHTP
jgi:hypothetical protein